MAIATPNSIGGYDYSFVESLHHRFICKICLLPSRDPHLSQCCGHVFCKSCLDKAATTSACPVCRDKRFGTFPQKEADREIKSLHIYCTNKEKGCEWQGELNNINNHLGSIDGCKFEEVKCFNECGKMIQRQYLTNHIETKCPRCKVYCQYCHGTGERQFIEGQHKEVCSKFPLPCPNKCKVESVPRKDMEAHRKKCPLEMIQCEYYSVGCEAMIARKDQEMHEDKEMKKHLMNTKCKLNNTIFELKNTKLDLTSIKDELADTKADLATTEATLADIKADLATTKATLADTKANSLQHINALEVLLYLATNKTVAMPTSRAMVLESSVRWSDKLVAMAMMSKSGDQECPVILMMSEYNKLKKHKASWYSAPFYTHNMGYKMCLNIAAAGDGDGKGTHLSWYLYLMKGPHDDELTWPLRGRFEIKLMNQISDNEDHSKIVTYGDNTPAIYANRVTRGDKAKGWGTPIFISNEDLINISPTCQYLKDHCLFFQVTKL